MEQNLRIVNSQDVSKICHLEFVDPWREKIFCFEYGKPIEEKDMSTIPHFHFLDGKTAIVINVWRVPMLAVQLCLSSHFGQYLYIIASVLYPVSVGLFQVI